MTNGCYFNISHSHGLVACAVAEVPVGIDVEKIRPVPPRLLRILSPAEREYVRCDEDFFRLWTLKEALIKCRGGVLGQIRHVHFDLSGSSIIAPPPAIPSPCSRPRRAMPPPCAGKNWKKTGMKRTKNDRIFKGLA